MILQRLHLLHFKSIASASCTFSPKVNCFIGLNGMGKTNLLDALHYLSFTKSHLSITDSLAVQYGQEAAVLDAVYRSDFGDERQLLLQIRPGHRKVLKRNKKEYPKLSDHIGAFPLVIVSPQDYQLILGGSDERRRFVDKQLSQQDSVYMAALAQYHRILEQRNVLLKSQRAMMPSSKSSIYSSSRSAHSSTSVVRPSCVTSFPSSSSIIPLLVAGRIV